jgi:DNA-binding MarR family transcriptional regulator
MSATDGAIGSRPADDEPPWLSAQEQDTWLGVATIALQLPGLLEAQLQKDAELGLFDYMVLSWLSMFPQRRLRMGELARLARGSMSRLSNVVKRLEERGFVQRAPDPDNGRYTIAMLTDTGWAKVVDAAPGHIRAVRRYVLDPLTTEQVRALQEVSGRIAERIRDGAGGGLTADPSQGFQPPAD